MDWDALRRKYPDDAEGIGRAQRIHTVVAEKVRKLDILEAGEGLLPGDVIQAIPHRLLAGVCTEAWVEVMGGRPEADLEKALKAFAAGEPLPDADTDTQDVLSMFLRPAVTEYLKAAREKSGNPEDAAWGRGECPFCGTHPRIALDSETSRELVCLLCGRQWRFRRVKCPFCGNSDHNTLGYFDIEGAEGVRVQYCSECRHYLKVVDTRKRPVSDAETEDVLSLDLDAAAQGEGYL